MDAMQSHAAVADVPIKRPPEDEELFDPFRAPPKRQAMETPVTNGHSAPSTVPPEAIDHQLIGKTPGELVTIILSMRSSHEQELVKMQNQYAAVRRQLDQLTNILNSHFASQISALQSVQQSVASISNLDQTRSYPSTAPKATNTVTRAPAQITSNPFLPPASRQTPVPSFVPSAPTAPVANGLTTTPTPRSSRFEAPSAASFTASQTPTKASAEPQEKKDLKITPSPNANEPPTVEVSYLETAWEAWEEFRYGRSGNPSLETLDAIWGPRWRQEFKLREFYKRRKAIADKIKQYMADGIDEQSAVRAMDTQRGKRKLNWLSLRILDERKAQKEQYKEARKAALANKAALQSSGAVPAAVPGPPPASSQDTQTF